MHNRDWIKHFKTNRDCDPEIPWDDPYILNSCEYETIKTSIQEFELGENARGRSFRARGRLFAMKSGDTHYPGALKLFIEEEQRHSAYLRLFMTMQNIPLLKKTVVDSIFRRIRKLADLDCMISVLLVAEIFAMSYYRALRKSTASPVLKTICKRILSDEVAHLQFQGENLGKVRQSRSVVTRKLLMLMQYALLLGTSVVVWLNHARVFRAAGTSYMQLVRRSLRFQRRIDFYVKNANPKTCPARPREKVYAR